LEILGQELAEDCACYSLTYSSAPLTANWTPMWSIR